MNAIIRKENGGVLREQLLVVRAIAEMSINGRVCFYSDHS